MGRTLIKSGIDVTMDGNVPDLPRGDVLIEDGRIAAVESAELLESDAPVYDARGCWVVPGLVDMHVHLREPGYEYKETVATGAAAAAAGGFTSIACMANTNPVNDSAAVTRFILEQGAAARSARVHPIGAVSVGLAGKQLAEIGEMRRAGIVAVSDDGMPIMDAGLMRRALEYTTLFDLLVIAHEEDACLRGAGVMNEGLVSVRLGLKGSPPAAEELMVARDIALVELTGGRLHVAHVSTARSVALVREARQRGLRVSAEATPHHLILTEDAVAEYDANAKMAPPLRTRADVDALRAGLADGTVEAIATDHAPHHADEKECEFDQAANGVVGLETALGLGLRLVAEGVLDVPALIARMTTGPARLLGIPAGTLDVGAAADVAVIDPERRWKVAARSFKSKSRNTPFDGWDLQGKAVATFVGGRLVYEDRPAASPLRVAS
jgi:dihydroorotase